MNTDQQGHVVVSKYKQDDVVFVPVTGRRMVLIKCPVCFGKRKVIVILGDDTRVEIPCDYCSRSFEGPTGTVVEWISEPASECVTIKEIQIAIDQAGVTTIRYIDTICRGYEEDDVFDTPEEALKRAQEIAARQTAEEKERNNGKAKANKSYSWNVGYHLREAKRLRKEIEYHERQAAICKGLDKQQ